MYWMQHGSSAPNLQLLATRIFAQPVSASASERNWSIFEWLLGTRRNKLKSSTVTKMVKIKMHEEMRNRAASGLNDVPRWITEYCDEDIDAPSHTLFSASRDDDDDAG
jgi:hypothetical protein